MPYIIWLHSATDWECGHELSGRPHALTLHRFALQKSGVTTICIALFLYSAARAALNEHDTCRKRDLWAKVNHAVPASSNCFSPEEVRQH